MDGIDIIDFQDEESSIVSKGIDSEISPSKLDGFKGIESEYVSLTQEYQDTVQEEKDTRL